MITLSKTLPDINVRNVAYVRLMCLYAAYCDYPKIALFWVQRDGNQNVTALISLIDSNMIICRSAGDTEELRSFINAVSPTNIFTDLQTANSLGLDVTLQCASLYKSHDFDTTQKIENTYEGLDKVYSVLSKHLPVGDKQGFIADMSHRIRRGTAGYVTSKYSAGVILFNESFATLAGIAVESDNRLSGLGTATLNRLLEIVKHREVYICAEYKNVPFYEKNGFTVESKVAYCTLAKTQQILTDLRVF